MDRIRFIDITASITHRKSQSCWQLRHADVRQEGASLDCAHANSSVRLVPTPAGEGLPVHVGYDTARLRQPSTRWAVGLGEAVRIDLSCRLPTRPESRPGPSPLWSDGSARGDDLVRNRTEEVSP